MILNLIQDHDRCPPEARDERRQIGTQILIAQALWDEFGSTLNLLLYKDVSPEARTKIRETLERVTGTKAPEYLGGKAR